MRQRDGLDFRRQRHDDHGYRRSDGLRHGFGDRCLGDRFDPVWWHEWGDWDDYVQGVRSAGDGAGNVYDGWHDRRDRHRFRQQVLRAVGWLHAYGCGHVLVVRVLWRLHEQQPIRQHVRHRDGLDECVRHLLSGERDEHGIRHEHEDLEFRCVSPSTTYLLLVSRDSSANDSITSITSTGLNPAESLTSFTPITSQSYNSNNFQWAYYVTTPSNATGNRNRDPHVPQFAVVWAGDRRRLDPTGRQ